jgi:hypothetical protein
VGGRPLASRGRAASGRGHAGECDGVRGARCQGVDQEWPAEEGPATSEDPRGRWRPVRRAVLTLAKGRQQRDLGAGRTGGDIHD